MDDISEEQQDAILFIEFLEAAYKMGRNSGLEEAEQFFQDNDTNLFWGSQAAGYTESLKDNTP